jgi:hypothetical protein
MLTYFMLLVVSRDILIRIVIGYGLHNLGIAVLFPASARGVSLPQMCSRPGLVHAATIFSVGTKISFPGVKMAGV